MPPKLPSTRGSGAKSPIVARGQMDDKAPIVRIPTPEELGFGGQKVTSVTSESLDWAMVERKLDAAGATGYQMEKTSDGFRFTCKIASGPVAGRGATKVEAVRHALAQLAR
jgi:hypothetical protein